jgi:hypothetical protein
MTSAAVVLGVAVASGYEVYLPNVTHSWVVNKATSTLQYNHDSSVVRFKNQWITVSDQHHHSH